MLLRIGLAVLCGLAATGCGGGTIRPVNVERDPVDSCVRSYWISNRASKDDTLYVTILGEPPTDELLEGWDEDGFALEAAREPTDVPHLMVTGVQRGESSSRVKLRVLQPGGAVREGEARVRSEGSRTSVSWTW